MFLIDRRYRLAEDAGSLGIGCTLEGLWLAGSPLLRKTPAGIEPRPLGELGVLLKAAYARDVDAVSLLPALKSVARALNQGDPRRAMMGAMRLRLPELDRQGAARLARADEILSKYDPNEPRDWRGRWTAEGGTPPGAAGRETPRGPSGGGRGPRRQQQTRIRSREGRKPLSQSQPNPLGIARADQNQEAIKTLQTLYPRLEEEYDNLDSVEFSKRVFEFGDWLARRGKTLTRAQKLDALARYAFLQDRLSFWLDYSYKPAKAQQSLIGAAVSLYDGAVDGGVIGVGGKNGGFPKSMVDAAVGAMAYDGGYADVRPRRSPPPRVFEPYPERPPKWEANRDGLGGVIHNGKIGIKWKRGIHEQGRPFEIFIGSTLDPGSDLSPNAKTYDHYESRTGRAISDKTLYTNNYTYSQNPRNIFNRLRNYIDAVANSPGPVLERGRSPVTPRFREVQLAIPETTSSAQLEQLFRAKKYADQLDVRLVITRIRADEPE